MKIAVIDNNPIQREGVKRTLERQHLNVIFTGQEWDDVPESAEVILCFVDRHENQKWHHSITHAIEAGFKVVVFDRASDLRRATLFRKMGVHGYLSSSFSLDDFPQVEAVIKRSGFFLDPSLPLLLFDRMAAYERYIENLNPKVSLTKQEDDVLDLLIEGYTTKEISKRLMSTKRTIDDTRGKIFAKIGAVDNLSLILYRLCNRF
ncbi:LuxR C-terminal-related transcriptional regulator [Olivibacter sp. XZL3]|uniref:helix-turn-helix transcriptional regulator n=1 Tax=Olivibacter sp. XZL3 TaxID=1735116 RepID=UPI0010670097|nr:LuxR C-terminal-related transcriptional regulator [Olivibacter sp. XZL3]